MKLESSVWKWRSGANVDTSLPGVNSTSGGACGVLDDEIVNGWMNPMLDADDCSANLGFICKLNDPAP